MKFIIYSSITLCGAFEPYRVCETTSITDNQSLLWWEGILDQNHGRIFMHNAHYETSEVRNLQAIGQLSTNMILKC